MARQLHAVVVRLAVRVPVNATGSLADGATRVVERIDAVSHLEDVEVRASSPDSTTPSSNSTFAPT